MTELTNFFPQNLERLPDGSLRITWSDGLIQTITPRQLQDSCPCATCREKRTSGPDIQPMFQILKPGEEAPLQVLSMEPVGNYAYSVKYSHGCTRGIYSLDHLRSLEKSDNARS